MIKGLTKYGLGELDNLKTHVLLAKRNGFSVVDTDGSALRKLIEDKGLEETKVFLKESKVKIGAIQFPVNWGGSDEQFYSDLPQLLDDAKLAKEFGIEIFNTFFLPSTDEDILKHMISLTNRIKLSAQMISSFGCKIALEFVGPYHMRSQFKNEFIYDLSTTIDWIEMIGERNIGVLLDSLHWYVTGSNLKEITAMDSSQIAYVHINDAPNLPVEKVLDNGRVYPGEGVIDLVAFLQAVQKTGYRGPITQEVLTEKALEESGEVLAEKSSLAVSKIFEKARIKQ